MATSSKGKKLFLLLLTFLASGLRHFPCHQLIETLAKVLTDEIICRYGVPMTLHSDQGANLANQVISSLCKHLGIDRTQTMAYHPKGNGVERFNCTLEAMLTKLVNETHIPPF